MSFKRDGDDASLLHNLKRRRVSEVLVSHIPEDEALLLKNGRYACTVCYHKPIFDTIDMLSLHRRGKRHLANLTKHLAKQQELKLLEEKKAQELYVTKGSINVTKHENKPKASHHSLLKSGPYRRKMKIDIPPTLSDVQQNISEVKPRSASSLVRSYIKTLPRKKDFAKVVEMARIKSLGPSSKTLQVSSNEEMCKRNKSSSINKTIENKQVVDREKCQQMEYYLNVRASGWKKDKNGLWMKEDGVEFDSDEEPPADLS